MPYQLFLDDLRTIQMVYPEQKTSDFVIVRSYEAFVEMIQEKGLPNFISFDNDLGCDANGKVLPEGYDAAKWLVYESGLNLIDLKFQVHSANPIARENIKGLLRNYIQHLRENS